jgi:hypothetical protein
MSLKNANAAATNQVLTNCETDVTKFLYSHSGNQLHLFYFPSFLCGFVIVTDDRQKGSVRERERERKREIKKERERERKKESDKKERERERERERKREIKKRERERERERKRVSERELEDLLLFLLPPFSLFYLSRMS